VRYSFTFKPMVQVVVAIAVTAVLASLLPAIRAARTNVIETIGYE
jgi:ABC-type lipoprotein release transport system permease subunit